MASTEIPYYLENDFIEGVANNVVQELMVKKMYILTTNSLDRQQNEDKNILCDIINTTKTNPLAKPAMCKKDTLPSSGGSKKRTVTIKSNVLPKTVKGLKTRKKLLKERIKKAEKKVKLSKNRIIRLK